MRSRPYTPTDKPQVEGAFGLFSQEAPALTLHATTPEELAAEVVRLVVEELRKLVDELGRAQASGALDEDAATDAEYQVKKALNQAQKPDADKRTILDYLAAANEVITTAAGATALVTAVTQAIQMVQKLF